MNIPAVESRTVGTCAICVNIAELVPDEIDGRVYNVCASCLDGEPNPSREETVDSDDVIRVLKRCGEPVPAGVVVAHLDESRRDWVYQRLHRLSQRGIVERLGREGAYVYQLRQAAS